MTYAQQLLAEGEAKGRAEGEARKQVEMVEGFLRVGVTWDVIEAATGPDRSWLPGARGAVGRLWFVKPAPPAPGQALKALIERTSGRGTP